MVLCCPHCKTVHIVVGGEPDTDVCSKRGCGGIMERLIDDPCEVIANALIYHDLPVGDAHA